MKTILIAHNYTENSFAFMSYYLAHYLASLGNKVIFISHKPFFEKPFRENIEKGELLVYSWPTQNRPVKLSDAVWFAKIYLKYKPSVIISHFVSVNITIIISKLLSLGKVKTYPYYHTLSSQILGDSKKTAFRINLEKYRKRLLYHFFADAIICPSDLANEDLKKYFDLKNGIKVLNPLKDRFYKKNEISPNLIVISYLGRLEPSKGVLDLIKAFVKYKRKFTDSKIILNIAGTGSQQEKIQSLIDNNPGIIYHGGLSYDKIDTYLNESHFTVISSKFDNLPTVGLESMMNQTPLLISNTTGLSSELEEGLECFKFNSTIEEMVLLFERVENNFDKQQEMGINARKTFLKKFGIYTYCQTIEKLVENV